MDLVTSGRIPPGRAIDLGCGSGANSIFLAEHRFNVTGVDISPIGPEKARSATPTLSIERLTEPAHGSGSACFLMRRS